MIIRLAPLAYGDKQLSGAANQASTWVNPPVAVELIEPVAMSMVISGASSRTRASQPGSGERFRQLRLVLVIFVYERYFID
jgi:hypothetical protein